MKNPHSKRCNRFKTLGGMSLVELLIVMAIVLVMFGLVGLCFQSLGRTADLTNSIQYVTDTLNIARQIAVSRNEYTQVRLYGPQEGSADYRAGQLTAMTVYRADSAYYTDDLGYNQLLSTGRMRQEIPIVRLPQSCIIVGNSPYSPLIQTLSSETNRKVAVTVDGTQYEGVAFYFKPDGSLDIPSTTGSGGTATINALSVCAMSAFVGAGNKLPANYGIVNIDRINGRFQIVRP